MSHSAFLSVDRIAVHDVLVNGTVKKFEALLHCNFRRTLVVCPEGFLELLDGSPYLAFCSAVEHPADLIPAFTSLSGFLSHFISSKIDFSF